MAWIWIILALLYLLSPYDLLPDFLPIRGWIDDMVVLLLVTRYVTKKYRSRQTSGPESGSTGERTGTEEKTQSASGTSANDPYTVLGVARDAAPDEIRAAYRGLANQYHPDKVSHLGKEFQELAEKRFKEIQQAYDQLKVRW